MPGSDNNSTVLIPKNSIAYLSKKSLPPYDGDDRPALYASFKRISESQNDFSDFLVDVRKTRMDMNTFTTLSDYEYRRHCESDDYYIFEGVLFEPTEEYVSPAIHPDEDEDIDLYDSTSEEENLEATLSLFDVINISHYKDYELQQYLDAAVTLEKYDISAEIRDYCEKNKIILEIK